MSFFQTLSEIRPPKPTFTEENVPDLAGRVYIITGASSGIGLELARILYWKNAKIYCAGRSLPNFEKAVENIKATPALGLSGPTKGELVFMCLDLTDLRTIKPAVEEFLKKEDMVHSVWYNAGVMLPDVGTTTVQGYELQWGTNVVAHFLLHLLLTPILISSARRLPTNTVRTIWVSSLANKSAPEAGGINWEDINHQKARKGQVTQWTLYGQSKAGDIILGNEIAKRLGDEGIVSVGLSPGGLKTGLQRNVTGWVNRLMNFIMYEARYGALTELYAGFSDDLSTDTNNGVLIIPWGRIGLPRLDIQEGMEGRCKKLGEGVKSGEKLWGLLEGEVKPYR